MMQMCPHLIVDSIDQSFFQARKGLRLFGACRRPCPCAASNISRKDPQAEDFRDLATNLVIMGHHSGLLES